MTHKKISIKDLAKLALTVQDASNFSGVAHSLSHEVIPNIRDFIGENYADEIAHHAIIQLFVFKLYSLTVRDSLGDQDVFSRAFHECKRLSEMADNGQPSAQDVGSAKQG